MKKRIIARLDIKGPNLVKGIHLEGLRVLGSPKDFASYYSDNGADELCYMDVVASLYNRSSLFDLVRETAELVSIPLAVGGGLRNIDDIKKMLRSGADKVILNTAAVRNPELITEAALKFGSSTIAIAIESIRDETGNYFAFTDNGREESGMEVQKWAQTAEKLGAGEIVLTSVDREGTGRGVDEKLIQMVSRVVNIPVIAHGGVGTEDDCKIAFYSGADALAIASLFHYNSIDKVTIVPISKGEGNREFLNNRSNLTRFKETSIIKIKDFLEQNGIPMRTVSRHL